MKTILDDTIRIARKDHDCSLTGILLNYYSSEEIGSMAKSISERTYENWITHKNNNFKIIKGDEYRDCRISEDGEIEMVRESLIAVKLCTKLNLWDDIDE